MYKIAVKTHFDAAHLIRDYPGKCRFLHGHRWEVEVIISSHALDKMGMAVDFGLIKGILKEIVGKYDHKNLVEIPPFDKINPTAENIAREIYEGIKEKTPEPLTIDEIKVWESPECRASYLPE